MADLFVTDGALWLTCLAVALAMAQGGRGPLRYGLALCLLAGGLTLVLPVRSVVSFGVSLLAVTVLYHVRPFRSSLPLLALPLLSPFARYLDSVLGVELRLGLSRAGGTFFERVGREVVVHGTDIALDGRTFGVDAACAGLHMLLVGLAMALLLLALAEYTGRRTFRVWVGAAVVALTVGLVAVGNLARVIVLVDRGWGPETALHDGVGLACFAAYVLLPLSLGTTWLVRQDWATSAGHPQVQPALRGPAGAIAGTKLRWGSTALRGLLLLGVACSFAFAKTRPGAVPAAVREMPALLGQAPELRAHDVLAYRFPDALVYRKPIPAFYNAEHSPLICWRGSGYEIVDIRRERLAGGAEVYRGTLRREGQRLHTAWWMSNGDQTTLDQYTWRSAMARGAPPFALVNVTAAGEAELMCWVEELVESS